MIGTSDGKQYNSELDYLLGNEPEQPESTGPVTQTKKGSYEDFRPSTNVEDYRNEVPVHKWFQQLHDQIDRFKEDPMKFIVHGQDGWRSGYPALTTSGQDYNDAASRMIGHEKVQPTIDRPPQDGYQTPLEARTAVIIRHGDTHYTEDDKAHGWSPEGLTDKGAQEVWKYADLKDKPDVLVTSDLPRTVETAAIVSEKTGIPVAEKHQGLRTWDIGDFQGKPCKEVDPELKNYVNNPDKPTPNGESFNEFKDRVLGSVKDVMDRFPNQKVGLVTHSKVQKLLDAYDSTDGQYVDHNHFNEADEAPGKEKTMKLTMNDDFGVSSYPVLSPDALQSSMSRQGMHPGVSRTTPHANDNSNIIQHPVDASVKEYNMNKPSSETLKTQQLIDKYPKSIGMFNELKQQIIKSTQSELEYRRMEKKNDDTLREQGVSDEDIKYIKAFIRQKGYFPE
jgi:broad specificity phosphatase PhoE